MGKNKSKASKTSGSTKIQKKNEPKKQVKVEKVKKVVEEKIPSSDSESESDDDLAIDYNKTIDENVDQMQDDDDDDAYDKVDVDFSFNDPCPDDFMYVRTFLQKNLLLGAGKDFNYNDLSEYICNQPEVGAMVKVNEEKDVYAFMSILNVTETRNNCLKEIIDYIKGRCPKEQKESFSKICDDPTTGFLFNERMINFPPQLIPNLLTSLKEDVEWATTNNDITNKEQFKFKNIIFISPCYIMNSTQQSNNESKKNKKKNTNDQSKQINSNEQLVFAHYEDQIIEKFANCNFGFHVPQMVDTDLSDAIPQARKIIVFPFEKLNVIIEQTQSLLE